MPRKPRLAQKIEGLFADRHLLSASDIVRLLKKSADSYNKTSVYRALDQLLEKGILCQQYFTDGQALYELREDHHTHMVCKNCQKILVADCDYHPSQKIKNFTVEHHHVTLVGLCDDCNEYDS